MWPGRPARPSGRAGGVLRYAEPACDDAGAFWEPGSWPPARPAAPCRRGRKPLQRFLV